MNNSSIISFCFSWLRWVSWTRGFLAHCLTCWVKIETPIWFWSREPPVNLLSNQSVYVCRSCGRVLSSALFWVSFNFSRTLRGFKPIVCPGFVAVERKWHLLWVYHSKNTSNNNQLNGNISVTSSVKLPSRVSSRCRTRLLGPWFIQSTPSPQPLSEQLNLLSAPAVC